MKLTTTAQMRELERRTIEEAQVKGEELMERAGFGVADIVRRLAEVSGFFNATVHLIAGRGNNGGDAFCAARHLKEAGFGIEVWMAGRLNQLTGDAFAHYQKMKQAGIKAFDLPAVEDWQDAVRQPFFADIIVDGVLGTGLEGPARGPSAGAIRYINSQSNESLVVSIDVPSGLDADTGRTEGDAVHADITATVGLPKLGLLAPDAVEFVGTLDVVDIGLPDEYLADIDLETEDELIHGSDLKRLFLRRPRTSHKGNYGHVLVVAGAAGYAGAAVLATEAALRSGAGLVSALVPAGIRDIVAGCIPEAMIHGGAEDADGALTGAAWDRIKPRLDEFSGLLVGPGLSRAPGAVALVRRILAESDLPMVIDADGLNALAGQLDLLAAARAPVILTPHPGELARLLGGTAADVQADRRTAAIEAARRTKCTMVLKGAGTIVTGPQGPLHINMTGNPGLATGGTGDLLAGLTAGLLAQGFKPLDAARAAVHVHGRAGDLAAWRKCQISLTAGDVVAELPFAFRELSLR